MSRTRLDFIDLCCYRTAIKAGSGAMLHIFLSAVSAEFRSHREALRHDLEGPKVTVKIQEDFIATGTETLDKLDTYIQKCDVVIHLVGDMTGALAQAPSVACIRQRYPDLGQRIPVLGSFLVGDASCLSYTQWEAWLALYHGKMLIIAVPQEGAPRDALYRLDETQRAAQQEHLGRLAAVERYPEIRFASVERLAVEVLRSRLRDIYSEDDVTGANSGIRLLKELISDTPAVADAVSRSKETLEDTYRHISNLALFKRLHDALHTIEFECLRPMEAGGSASRLRPFKIRYAAERQRIHDAIHEHKMSPALRDELADQLDSTAAAFQAAVDMPTEAAYRQVVGRLHGLLSGVSPQLDVAISVTASELKLDRLVALMTRVRDKLPAKASMQEGQLDSLVQAIDALKRLEGELAQRVVEHGHLQHLDSKLRTVCVAGVIAGTLGSEWERIKTVRCRIVAPFSPELDAVNDDLVAIASEVEAAVKRGDERLTLELLGEYFRLASSAFRDADTGLKEFSLRLSAVSEPLKTLLSAV